MICRGCHSAKPPVPLAPRCRMASGRYGSQLCGFTSVLELYSSAFPLFESWPSCACACRDTESNRFDDPNESRGLKLIDGVRVRAMELLSAAPHAFPPPLPDPPPMGAPRTPSSARELPVAVSVGVGSVYHQDQEAQEVFISVHWLISVFTKRSKCWQVGEGEWEDGEGSGHKMCVQETEDSGNVAKWIMITGNKIGLWKGIQFER